MHMYTQHAFHNFRTKNKNKKNRLNSKKKNATKRKMERRWKTIRLM